MSLITEALSRWLPMRERVPSNGESSSLSPRGEGRGEGAWMNVPHTALSPALRAGLSPKGEAFTAEEKGSSVGPLIAYHTLGEPVWAPRDYAAFAREGFMQNAIVYRCVRMIAEAAASIPLLLYEGTTEIEDHPLIGLLRRPSLDHTGTDFLEAWYGFLLVSGNAYAEAVALDGELRELHILRPDRMKVIPGIDGWPEGYEYTVCGQSVRFIDDAVEGVRPILHLKLFHPVNDHYGMSPIEAAATAIDIHNTASGWNKALLDNSARPSGALVYAASNGQMTDEQFTRLKGELETNFQGARAAGRPLLLEGGLDWKPLSLSPKDMDFIEAKNAAAREIALAIGVPPMLLGIPGDNTYSNYQEAQRAFWRQTVLPLVNRTARALASWLAPAFETRPALGGRLRVAESLGANKNYGRPPSALELRPDLDQIEALAPERDALWKRLEAASFLTTDEKRAAAGYELGSRLAGRESPSAKYREDQPRVPAGQSGGGQWTDGGGGAGEARVRIADASRYSPDKPGWHHYTAGPNIGCDAKYNCSEQEAADQFSRFAVPGQDPSQPVKDGDYSVVRIPGTSEPVGLVRSIVSADGLTIKNTTLEGHIFHDGEITRHMQRWPDGSWRITTEGKGNNVTPGMNVINELTGPAVFDAVDRQLRENVRQHHETEGKSGQSRMADAGNNCSSGNLIGNADVA